MKKPSNIFIHNMYYDMKSKFQNVVTQNRKLKSLLMKERINNVFLNQKKTDL